MSAGMHCIAIQSQMHCYSAHQYCAVMILIHEEGLIVGSVSVQTLSWWMTNKSIQRQRNLMLVFYVVDDVFFISSNYTVPVNILIHFSGYCKDNFETFHSLVAGRHEE